MPQPETITSTNNTTNRRLITACFRQLQPATRAPFIDFYVLPAKALQTTCHMPCAIRVDVHVQCPLIRITPTQRIGNAWCLGAEHPCYAANCLKYESNHLIPPNTVNELMWPRVCVYVRCSCKRASLTPMYCASSALCYLSEWFIRAPHYTAPALTVVSGMIVCVATVIPTSQYQTTDAPRWFLFYFTYFFHPFFTLPFTA